jgi:formylglycine-generating enzyme required for sulfatase activity
MTFSSKHQWRWVGVLAVAGCASVAQAAGERVSVTGGDWFIGLLTLVLLIQCVVLVLVLLRLNRLLKSMGTIGMRLQAARGPAPRPREEAPGPLRIPTTSAPATSFERTTIMPAMTAASARPGTFTNDLGMKFVQLGPAEFAMGSADPESPDNERPVHKVQLSRSFWMAMTPVTNAQYEQFDPDHRQRRPSWNGDDHPVVCVRWSEATAFCLWLSQRDGREYRLPTEAEWEFAARGTDERIFPWGSFWDPKRCNSAEESDGFAQTSPVKQFPEGASPHGILDMVGNVWEWCSDWFAPSYGDESPRSDPTGPPTGNDRVCRGGSWMNHGYSCRTTMRARRPPDFSDNYIGFRVVCVTRPD